MSTLIAIQESCTSLTKPDDDDARWEGAIRRRATDKASKVKVITLKRVENLRSEIIDYAKTKE